MHTFTRRLAAAVLAAGLVGAAGCSSGDQVSTSSTTAPVTAKSGDQATTTTTEDEGSGSGSGSGEYEEACATIEEIDQLQGDDDLAAGLELFDQARDAGPEELVEHWDTLKEVLTELDTIDENDPEFLTRMFELMDDPAFVEAAKTIDDFAEEECGLDIDLDPTEESTGGLTEDTIVTETTDPDDDPTSIDAVQAVVASRFGTESWYSVFDENVSWSASGVSTVTWQVYLGDDPEAAGATTADLVDVCDAMAEHLDEYESGDVEIEIIAPDDAVLVSRAAGEPCQAA